MMILRVFPAYAKKRCSCNYCDTEDEKSITKDEPVVVIVWKVGRFLQKRYYHPSCALGALQFFFEDWFDSFTPGHTKIGRPQKTSNPKQYRRLMARLRYHKKQGNKDEVKEIKEEIRVLLETTQEEKEETVQVQERKEPLSEEEKVLSQIAQAWEGGEKAFPRPNERGQDEPR